MFKKEYFLFFIVISLSIVYALFAFLVFITRGKSPSILKTKIAMALKIITIAGIINSAAPAFSQEATPTPIVALYAVFTPQLTADAIETPAPTPLPAYAILTPDVSPAPPYGILPTPENTALPLYGILPTPYITADPDNTPAPTVLGDVNSDGSVDIVDALKIAQYYVGLNPVNFDASVADVNNSGTIDIVDALLVARKYVGLISEFPKP